MTRPPPPAKALASGKQRRERRFGSAKRGEIVDRDSPGPGSYKMTEKMTKEGPQYSIQKRYD